jgi:hypothetical protein
MSPERFY